MLVEVFAKFTSVGFLIGEGVTVTLFKSKNATPTATTAATVARTIATIAPADNPFEVVFLEKVFHYFYIYYTY